VQNKDLRGLGARQRMDSVGRLGSAGTVDSCLAADDGKYIVTTPVSLTNSEYEFGTSLLVFVDCAKACCTQIVNWLWQSLILNGSTLLQNKYYVINYIDIQGLSATGKHTKAKISSIKAQIEH
jgi:hypothetical protein